MEISIEQLKSGDPAAFEEFVLLYQQRVYRTAFKIIGDEHLANDAAQEVFIKVYRSIDRFKEESQLSTWVYRITVNVAIDFQRRLARSHTLSLTPDEEEGPIPEPPDTGPTPESTLEQKELSAMLQKAIDQLSENHRSVLVLRDVEGLPYKDIAQTLGCTEGTMKSRLKRAREALRNILKKDGYFSGK